MTSNLRRTTVLLSLGLAAGITVSCRARAGENDRTGESDHVGESPTNEEALADAEFQVLTKHIPSYVMTTEGESPTEFTFHPDPLQRWSNPLRRTKDACTFLWTHEGRPAVVAAAYWTSDRVFFHEFQTLHAKPFVAQLNGTTIWTPRRAGVVFKPYPRSQRVSSKRPVRLAHMRSIAGSFKAYLGSPQQPKQALRLLRHPLFRYDAETEAEGVVDGAMFAYVTATDPDMFVLIEARQGDDQVPSWHVGFARMATSNQFARYDGSVFWQVSGAQHWRVSNNYRTVKNTVPAPDPSPVDSDSSSGTSSMDADAVSAGEADLASTLTNLD